MSEKRQLRQQVKQLKKGEGYPELPTENQVPQ